MKKTIQYSDRGQVVAREGHGIRRGAPVLLAACLACSVEGMVSDPDTVCKAFEGSVYTGLYDSGTSTGNAIIFEHNGTLYDADRNDPTAEPYPLRDAPMTLWASGGAAYPDSRLGLALCVGADCSNAPDERWVRRLKTTTNRTGFIQFSTYVGYGVAGAIVVEFDNASCTIEVTSAEIAGQ